MALKPQPKREQPTAEILPPMQKVKSSNIEGIGYKANARQLYVKFTNGGIYRYEGVPQAAFDKLRSAESVGTALRRDIVPGHKAVKIEPGS